MWKFAAGKFNVRKIFSLLVALALLLACTPAAAVDNFAALQAAIADFNTSATADTTITITGSVDITSQLQITNTAHALTITSDGTARTLTRSGVPISLVLVNANAKLILEDITLDGANIPNTSSLVNVQGGRFVMNDGVTLQNNMSDSAGGGVRVNINGIFDMAGGRIVDNTAPADGGGVDVASGGTFNMTGGEISGNVADTSGFGIGGGGVFVGIGGAFTIGGDAVINNNTLGGNANNVSLANNAFITIGTGPDAPAPGMDIGVTKTANAGEFVQNGASAAHAQNFTADAPGNVVAWDTGGALRIAAPVDTVTVTITYGANGGTGTMADSSLTSMATVGGVDYTVRANEFTRIGHNFTGWNTLANGSGTPYAAGDVISGVLADITLFAQWQAITGGDNGTNIGGGDYEYEYESDEEGRRRRRRRYGCDAGFGMAALMLVAAFAVRRRG